MSPDHYAIVIGLSSYPRLGPPPADLKGPERDAEAVMAWLMQPGGGGLPPANVKIIRSCDFNSPPASAPNREDLNEAFLWLNGLANANLAKGKGLAVGSRLYLYAAGHGFSPKPMQGCILAANAAEKQFSANVSPSGWIDWLQDARYFKEFVLWLDCCMDPRFLTVPTAPPLDPIIFGGAAGPSFIAFAAPRPLKAVEKQIPEDGDLWHGVFTWNLLQGLRGAAANADGTVTAQSLADWLRQAQLDWLEEADRSNPDVAKEPAILEGGDLIFVRDVRPLDLDVQLHFPDAMRGGQARLWSGAPARPGAWFVIAGGSTTLRLRPGLYLAELHDTGLRHGFSVTRSGPVTLNEIGDPPLQTAGSFKLSIDPGDTTASIRVVKNDFSYADGDLGKLLSRSLPFGLYQMRIQIGRQIAEKVILLDFRLAEAIAPNQRVDPGDRPRFD